MPKRIQRKRTKGWRMPKNAVYVGRPSKWGNPFTGPDAVEKYRQAVSLDGEFVSLNDNWRIFDQWRKAGGDVNFLDDLTGRSRGTRKKLLNELRGKNLVCWCSLEKSCHADVLLKLANGNFRDFFTYE